VGAPPYRKGPCYVGDVIGLEDFPKNAFTCPTKEEMCSDVETVRLTYLRSHPLVLCPSCQ
jgi:hypothetical protein